MCACVCVCVCVCVHVRVCVLTALVVRGLAYSEDGGIIGEVGTDMNQPSIP